MSEYEASPAARFANAMAVVALLVSLAALVGFATIGPVRCDRPDPSPTSRPERPSEPSPREPRQASLPRRRTPFADLEHPNPRTREFVLRSPAIRADWFRHSDTTPEQRAEAAALVRKAFADDDPAVRLAAAEFAVTVQELPELDPGEAVPVWETLLTDADVERRVTAAVHLWVRTGSADAGKVLVAVVKNRAADAKLRTRAAGAVTVRPTLPRPEGMTAALDAILLDRTDDSTVRWFALDALKRDQGKGNPLPGGLRTTLLALAERDDPELGLTAVKELTIDIRRHSTASADLRPVLFRLVEGKATRPALRAAAVDALLAGKPDADTRRLAEALLDDPDTAADVRATAFALLTSGVKAGAVPDALGPRVVRVAADPATPDDVRIPAFRLLAPESLPFATDYPELATALEKAVGDQKATPEFRAYAAGFFKPDTAEKFARAVGGVLADGLDAKPLAAGLLARFPDGQRPPKEWVTAEVVGWIARSNAPVGRLEPLFHALLTEAGPAAAAALGDGLNNRAEVRARNLALLAKLGPDAKPAAARVFAWLARPDTTDTEKKLIAQLVANLGPDEVGKGLTAKDTPENQRAVLLKELRAAGRESLPPLVELLAHQAWEVRAWAAAEIGKIGPDAKGAVPALAATMKADIAADKKAGLQPRHAPFAEALAAVGPDCLPAVTELTTDAEPMVRVAAAEVFGYLGAEVRSKATPLLRKLITDDKDGTVKAAALHALGQVNPKEAEKLGWVPPQAKRPDPVEVPVSVDRPVPVSVDRPTAYTTPTSAKPYTPPYRPYTPVYRPPYIPRR